MSSLLQTFCFLIGFAIGPFIMLTYVSSGGFKDNLRNFKSNNDVIDLKALEEQFLNQNINTTGQLYDHEIADKLFNKIRILCWVFTHPSNHKVKVPHVRNTWGRKCNKLLFMSVSSEPDYPDIIALPIEDGRPHLWNKTRLAMKYVYENHINDADWFMRADDDNFILMENLRYTLAQYHPETSLYIGHRFAVDYPQVREGYMAGGGHIFSRKALTKFVTIISPNNTLCDNHDGEADDLLVGQCLKKYAIFLDARDSLNQKQIFPVGVEEHMKSGAPDMSYWYWRNLWRNVAIGSLDCCSDVYIGAHYVSTKEMYFLQHLIYKMHPFGLQKNLTETMPRKLTLKEIIKASDAKSLSPNFVEHENIHYIDDDEKYKRK